MHLTKKLRALLLVSALIAMGIGATLLVAPVAFHAGYGTDLGTNANLLSEVRAPGGALLALGITMLIGAFIARATVPALGIGAAVYLSYGLSRLVSMAADGMPHQSLVLATVLELVIGLLCAFALLHATARTPHFEQVQ